MRGGCKDVGGVEVELFDGPKGDLTRAFDAGLFLLASCWCSDGGACEQQCRDEADHLESVCAMRRSVADFLR